MRDRLDSSGKKGVSGILCGIERFSHLWKRNSVGTIRPKAAVPDRLLISYLDPANSMKNDLTLTLAFWIGA
jgi:hypothetical protein